MIGYSVRPHGANYNLLDFPNISISRGLQSANGYDPVYLTSYKALAGDMSLVGDVRELSAFGPDDQAFNLLNVKYLLSERLDLMGGSPAVEREGIRFSEDPVNILLAPGKQMDLKANVTATELAIISAMGMSGRRLSGSFLNTNPKTPM